MLRWSEKDMGRLRMVLETERQQSVWAMARKAQETIKHRSVQAIAHKIRELLSEEEAQSPKTLWVNNQEYKTKNISGYAHILVDGKYIPAHIYLWESYFGKVPEGFHVHHRNTKRYDNWIDNLTLMTASEHIMYHHSGSPAETEMLFWFLQERNLWQDYLEYRNKIVELANE